MQRRHMYATGWAQVEKGIARLTRRTRFKFDALTQPLTPDTLNILIKGYCEQAQGGRIHGALEVGGRTMRAGQMQLSASLGEVRIAIPDEASRYDTITMTLWPEPNKTFVLSSGILEAPDPRYVYRVSHKFITSEDEAAFGRMSSAAIENPIFDDEADADEAYNSTVGRTEDEGSGTTDLGNTSNIDDGTTVSRTVQKQKIAVRPDWDNKTNRTP